MRNVKCLALALVMVSATEIVAQQPNEPTRFVRAFVNALGWANESLKAIDQGSTATGPEAEIELLYANKRARDFYDRAIAELSPFSNSSVDFISKFANAAIVTFKKYQEIIDESGAIRRDLGDTLAALKRGEKIDVDAKTAQFNERTADLRFRGDKVGELLVTAATGSSWVMYVIRANGEPEFPLRYAIGQHDRAQLATDLRHTFGAQITKGPSTDLTYIQLSAAILYKTITQGEGKQKPKR